MRNILLLYQEMIPSVRLCALEQCIFLQSNGLVEFRHCIVSKVKTGDLAWANTVLLVRSTNFAEQEIARVCREQGKILIYIVDDDLLNVPKDINSGKYYTQNIVRRRIVATMAYANAIASPSPRLLKKYTSRNQRQILIVEPALYTRKKKEPHVDGKIHIGFAGSIDRKKDVDLLLSDVLKQIKQYFGERISLEFFGNEPAIAKELECTTIPYQDSYEIYQNTMAELNWDIGLAPMQDSEFHACKHYNKLVEYCGFGIVGVYSNVLPYTEGVENEVTGIVCANTTEEWFGAVKRLIENPDDRQRMSQNCLEQARSVFSLENAALSLLRDIEKLPTGMSGWDSTWSWTLIRMQDYWNRFLVRTQMYGWKTPLMIVKKVYHFISKG